MALDAALRGMREAGATAVAVVSRDGTMLASDLPPGVSRETFSSMCAVIHGASMTVSSQLRRSMPSRILMESPDGRVLISEAGRRALLVVVLAKDADVAAMTDRLQPFRDQVSRETA